MTIRKVSTVQPLSGIRGYNVNSWKLSSHDLLPISVNDQTRKSIFPYSNQGFATGKLNYLTLVKNVSTSLELDKMVRFISLSAEANNSGADTIGGTIVGNTRVQATDQRIKLKADGGLTLSGTSTGSTIVLSGRSAPKLTLAAGDGTQLGDTTVRSNNIDNTFNFKAGGAVILSGNSPGTMVISAATPDATVLESLVGTVSAGIITSILNTAASATLSALFGANNSAATSTIVFNNTTSSLLSAAIFASTSSTLSSTFERTDTARKISLSAEPDFDGRVGGRLEGDSRIPVGNKMSQLFTLKADGGLTISGNSSNSTIVISGTDKYAIVPSKDGDFVSLACTEMPETRFEDIMKVSLVDCVLLNDSKDLIINADIDEEFLNVCEEGTIDAISCVASDPAVVGAKVIDDKIQISVIAQYDCPEFVVVKLSGIRKGRLNKRFVKFTEDEALRNNQFWGSWVK